MTLCVGLDENVVRATGRGFSDRGKNKLELIR
jgi:hypothetical protein